MPKTKTFDCVDMKNQIQEAVEREYAGLTDDERRVRRAQELQQGDDPVSRKWRSLSKPNAPCPET